jgi:hypothetical protein
MSFSAFAGQQESIINNEFISFRSSSNFSPNKFLSNPIKNLQLVEVEDVSEKKEESFDLDSELKFSVYYLSFNRLGKLVESFDNLKLSYHFITITTPLFKLFHSWKLPFCC